MKDAAGGVHREDEAAEGEWCKWEGGSMEFVGAELVKSLPEPEYGVAMLRAPRAVAESVRPVVSACGWVGVGVGVGAGVGVCG